MESVLSEVKEKHSFEACQESESFTKLLMHTGRSEKNLVLLQTTVEAIISKSRSKIWTRAQLMTGHSKQSQTLILDE